MKKNKKRCGSAPNTTEVQDKTGQNIFIAVLIVAAMFIIPLIVDSFLENDEAEELPIEVEPVSPVQTPMLTLETQSVSVKEIELPIHLGSSVYLTEIVSATGNYPENGKDEQGVNILAIRVRNDADKTIEYLTVGLTCDGESYQFAISTLPPGETVLAYEKAQKPAPNNVAHIEAKAGYLVFFTEEPSRMEEKLQIIAENGNIKVTNITDTDIASEFFVYYKNKVNDEYFGGITYRVRVSDGLKAGETYNGYAANSSTARTRIMFADDAE